VQFSVGLLSCALVGGAGALASGDYSRYPPESAPAARLSSAYLLDDNLSTGDIRLRLDKLGYTAALKVFSPALQRDPASSTRWIDVGESLLATGDRGRAEYCYRRAVALAPDDPSTLLAIGDFYATAHDAKRAIPYFSHILRLARGAGDEVLVGNVFVYYDSLRIGELNLVDAAIPDARSANAWLIHLMKNADPAVVRDTWHWMQAKGFTDDVGVAGLTRYLFAKKRFSAAGEDWAAHFAARHDGFPAQTRVFNGGFEYGPTNGEFDWRDDGFKDVKVSRDETQHHDGKYSMLFEFTGNDNPDFHHFGQTVFLPQGRYKLEGYLRTAAITGAEGLRLRVAGFQNASIFAETEALTGTNDWTPLSVTFDTPAASPLVEIQLVRRHALRIDNQLTGRVWLDSVSLTPVR
jgi:tetratricopeptide (TPR) repeat protein